MCWTSSRTGNLASNNAGPILAWDFLLPVVIVALYVLARPARDRVAITPDPVLVDAVATGQMTTAERTVVIGAVALGTRRDEGRTCG